MNTLEIYDGLEAKANEIEFKAFELEAKADKMHEIVKIIRRLVDGNIDFIVDRNGTIVTKSFIPEVTIRRRKRGDGFIVDFGKFGGAFHGFLNGFEGNGVIREATKVIAKVVYRKAKAYIKTMERSDDAEVLLKIDMCA